MREVVKRARPFASELLKSALIVGGVLGALALLDAYLHCRLLCGWP